jgi:hypothetical protein
MTLLGLVIVLILVGFALYAVPMEPRIKQVLIGVVILVVVLWVLQELGLLEFMDRPIFRHR